MGLPFRPSCGRIRRYAMPKDPRELVPITVELFVPDVDASARFYTEKLGFELMRMERGSIDRGERATFAVVGLGRGGVPLAPQTLGGGGAPGGGVGRRGAGGPRRPPPPPGPGARSLPPMPLRLLRALRPSS